MMRAVKQNFARLTDWIWHVRGSVPLPPGQSDDEAFARLDPLFQETGTSHVRTGDTLNFRKKDQAAQDRMSVFDGGMLQIRRGAAGAGLYYHMTSRALLYCFLAPLLFLAFGQLTVTVGEYEKASAEASGKTKKPEKKKDVVQPLHPIDQALGAPAPEKPKKDKDEDNEYSPKAAYILAAMFAALFVIGRILEAWLIRNLLRKSLAGISPARSTSAGYTRQDGMGPSPT